MKTLKIIFLTLIIGLFSCQKETDDSFNTNYLNDNKLYYCENICDTLDLNSFTYRFNFNGDYCEIYIEDTLSDNFISIIIPALNIGTYYDPVVNSGTYNNQNLFFQLSKFGFPYQIILNSTLKINTLNNEFFDGSIKADNSEYSIKLKIKIMK